MLWLFVEIKLIQVLGQSINFSAKITKLNISLPIIKVFPYGKLSFRLYIDFQVHIIFPRVLTTVQFSGQVLAGRPTVCLLRVESIFNDYINEKQTAGKNIS